MGKAFESIKQGLTEAIGHAKGTQAGVKVWRPAAVDVAAVRGRLGFTQARFAARFGVSVATLRHWERWRPQPPRPGAGAAEPDRSRPGRRVAGFVLIFYAARP